MDISIVLFGVIGASSIFLLIPLMLLQYTMHKKILDPTYYNTEHFSAGELAVFSSGFIFYLAKTLVYIRAIALPKTMRVRFKENILTFKDNPFVYLLASFSMLHIVLGALFAVNFIIALIAM